MQPSTRRYNAKRLRIIASLISFGFVATAAAQAPRSTHGVSPNRPMASKATATSAVGAQPLPRAQSGAVNSTQGVIFTCDANFDTSGVPAGLCAALNSIVPPLYSSTFTNVNASVYIAFDPNGLGTTTQFGNSVPYSTYRNALLSVSTGAAKAFVPAVEPSIFGTLPVGVTSALARHLALSGATSITAEGNSCSTPGIADCYDAIIHIVTPAGLLAETGSQGLTYRGLGGSTNGTTDNYDFFSVVEHELDEVLGTASCVSYTGPGTTDPPTCVSAEDLFRYTAPGARIFNTFGNSYFSADGGVTDLDGNTYNTTQGGGDWGDFSQNCIFVQDSQACPSGSSPNYSLDITNDGPGGTSGPEVEMLNAVGYNLNALATQTITFAALPNVTYGAGPITLTATASSGLTVTYTVTGPATLNGSTLTITGAGTVTVTASQAGNSSYSAATAVVRSFAVNKAPLTVTANNASRAVGAANPAFTYTITGFVRGDTFSVVSGTAPETTTATSTSPAGTYPITFSGTALAAANYTFTYVNGTLTITGSTTGNFTIKVIPPTETIRRGDLAGFILQLQSVNNFNGNVALSCSGGPTGSKCANFPMTVKVNGTGYAVSGILFPKNTTPGTYVVTFVGVSGSLTNTATAKFTVIK